MIEDLRYELRCYNCIDNLNTFDSNRFIMRTRTAHALLRKVNEMHSGNSFIIRFTSLLHNRLSQQLRQLSTLLKVCLSFSPPSPSLPLPLFSLPFSFFLPPLSHTHPVFFRFLFIPLFFSLLISPTFSLSSPSVSICL